MTEVAYPPKTEILMLSHPFLLNNLDFVFHIPFWHDTINNA